jgi:hypothetical protein
MAIEHQPQPDRGVISAREAARLLRRDVRTVRRMIEDDELDGGATAGPKLKRWYVYVDQIPAAAPERSAPPPSAVRDSDDLADLKAQIVTLKETNRLLSASNALSLAALEDYKAAIEGLLSVVDGYRQTVERLKAAAEGFHGALVHHQDALAQYTTPGHLGDSTTGRWTG